MSLEVWVNSFTYAFFLVLILIEVGTMMKLIKEGEHNQCIKILALYIISNGAMIVCTFLNTKTVDKLASNSDEVLWLLVTSGLAFAIFLTCSNVAHWLFCFEYYHTVRTMKYVHEEIRVPQKIQKCDRIQYWTWIILSIVSAIVSVVFLRIEYWQGLY